MSFNPFYDKPIKSVQGRSVRHYDVRITLNKCGRDNKFVCRFGFLNKAAEAFSSKPYIEVSSVKKCPKRIYFRLHDEKVRFSHVLSTNKNSTTVNKYTTITPLEDEEKLYRMNWVNNTYELKYDEENKLYFIENENN